jgi:beta-glucuronidase
MLSRRKFLGQSASLGIAALAAPGASGSDTEPPSHGSEAISLCGEWWFRTDPEDSGTKQGWFNAPHSTDWRAVSVPHTWQIDPALAEYRGIAWYHRTFDILDSWKHSAVRIEFEAVFHTATVWINGQLAGEHARKGYTAFTLDAAQFLRWGARNTIAVRVDSAFNDHMVPRNEFSDWATDGGIYRPVQLLVTPKIFVEQVSVEAVPDFATGDAKLTVIAVVRNTGLKPWNGRSSFRVIDDQDGLEFASGTAPETLLIKPGSNGTVTSQTTLSKPKLWHFDSPNLYRLDFQVSDGHEAHQYTTTFGVRRLEVRDGKFYFNHEMVRLMGVERMAGSNPTFGMAEPSEWITHDHNDLKALNCVFTRVHWPQDKRVLDYCDRHGILMQTEVPAWGEETFQGMGSEPNADIMENGLEQLREMIARDRNHPSVVVWGLCNEINGQNPPAYNFARRLLEEAKKLDSNRLCSYASNSLGDTPQRDVAALMDFVEANEYFGTWVPGTTEDLSRFLDELHRQLPGKAIVISEYGYCACVDDRPEGDGHRCEILRSHTNTIRSKDYVAGAIFFCYNDYRTHAGNQGAGALKQRPHGVVDLYGKPKDSYPLLRHESSPLEFLSVENHLSAFQLKLKTRGTLPSYSLRGYKLRAIFYGEGKIPVELQQLDLPDLSPGAETSMELKFTQSSSPLVIRFYVLRPTGFAAQSLDWKP